MKKSFLWAGCLAASLSLIACGDDSSTSVDNTDKTDSKIVESSSSMGEDGSSGSMGMNRLLLLTTTPRFVPRPSMTSKRIWF